jgi:hypothetical protein
VKMRFCFRLSIPQQKAVLFYIFSEGDHPTSRRQRRPFFLVRRELFLNEGYFNNDI